MKAIIGCALVLGMSTAAQAMSVSDFLIKADALKAKGPMALFSGDLKLLKTEVTTAAGQLRVERLAAEKAGRRPAYCPRGERGSLDSDELLSSLRAMPTADRARFSVKDGLRAHLARKFPC